MRIVFGLLVLLSAAASAAGASVPCVYLSRDEPAEMEPHPACATLSAEGTLLLEPSHLERVRFDALGVARVLVASRWFLVRSDGRSLEVVTYDNGPDEFSEGLVRARRQGKLGFCDAGFRWVIPATYDWVWPFEKGKAIACRGCKAALPDQDGHASVEGGAWGVIDRSGAELLPIASSREEAFQFTGSALP